MRKLAILILGFAILASYGCDAGTASGGERPKDEKFGPGNKPPGAAGAGGGATAPPTPGSQGAQ